MSNISSFTYRDLKHKLLAAVLGLNGVENSWDLLSVEFDCRGR
jgi:hypothetical protein